MKKRLALFGGVLLVVLLVGALALGAVALLWRQGRLPVPVKTASKDFLVQPYLQIGKKGDVHQPEIIWATTDTGSQWQLWIQAPDKEWQLLTKTEHRNINLEGVPAFRQFEAQLPELSDGEATIYKVTRDGKSVFESTVKALNLAANAYRFDVAGDTANGSPEQSRLAQQLYKSAPDLVAIPGDIVYFYGRTLEYLDHFFPVYNADQVTAQGVPMMRSTLFVAAPGNHDTENGGDGDCRDLNRFPDGLGYFLWWKQPLNGPDLASTGHDIPIPTGTVERLKAFLQATEGNYPRQTNFSFDLGNSHWTMLDGNEYVDWSQESLRHWLEEDLGKAKKATWKFVVFHQTAFNSDKHHFGEQHMRVLCDLFQKYAVDIVFSGHVHNYQRTAPLNFSLVKQPDGQLIAGNGTVSGNAQLDKSFDGIKDTSPQGVVYITTGGGGAVLTGKKMSNAAQRWQPFTKKFIVKHSFSQGDVNGKHLRMQQVDLDGNVLDEFSIDK